MKIVLAEAPFSYDESLVQGGRYFPLGIGYIASYIRDKKSDRIVKIFTGPLSEFEAYIQNEKPDVIGLSAMTSSYPTCEKMIEISKQINPECYVILGGQHATSVKGSVLREISDLNFVGAGEGEVLFDRFLEEIELKRFSWELVPGLIFRQDNNIKENPQYGLLNDLDSLPSPARDLVDLNEYSSHLHMRRGKKTANLISSRGCPWRCTYCSSHVTMGRKYRLRSAESVVDEMEDLYRSDGFDNFVFWDDVFTASHPRVFKFCAELKRRGLNFTWWCMSRTDRITEELAKEMASAGCVSISFGIESGSEETLKRIKKKVDKKVVREAIINCNKWGIRTQGTFILGFPHETKKDFNDTVEFAKSLDLGLGIFFSFTPYPGTEEWNHLSSGQYPKSIEEWRNFVCNSQLTKSWNSQFSAQEIQNEIHKAHMKFYLRPKQVFSLIKSVRTISEFKGFTKSFLSLLNSFIKNFLNSKKMVRQV